MRKIPKGATHTYVGGYYKKGAHGFIYRWSQQSNDWIRSDVCASLLNKGVKFRYFED